jgi:hypothetical protein
MRLEMVAIVFGDPLVFTEHIGFHADRPRRADTGN